jgi:hypothetical protein
VTWRSVRVDVGLTHPAPTEAEVIVPRFGHRTGGAVLPRRRELLAWTGLSQGTTTAEGNGKGVSQYMAQVPLSGSGKRTGDWTPVSADLSTYAGERLVSLGLVVAAGAEQRLRPT